MSDRETGASQGGASGGMGGGDSNWRQSDTLMNIYNNMMNQMGRFHREFNRAYAEHFGDNFFNPGLPSSSAAALNDSQNRGDVSALEGGRDLRRSFWDIPRRFFANDDFMLRDRPSQSTGIDVYSDPLSANRFEGLVSPDSWERRNQLWGGDRGIFGRAFPRFTCVPRVDVTDEGNHYLVNADVPGMRKDDVKVNVQNGQMSISGGRVNERKEDGKDYVLQERCNSQFYRSFPLPQNIKDDEIKANFHSNGTLTVTIPKDEASAKKTKRSINIE